MSRRRWSTTVRRRIWDRFNRTCQMCRQPTDERGFDLDHHIPLALGGDDEETNLRPLCKPCHRLKTATVDVPGIAKAVRNADRHTGARAPRAKIAGPPRKLPKNPASAPLNKWFGPALERSRT